MTKLLQKASDEASKLPESEQDALGRLLVLAALAEQALAVHRAGRAEKLDPDKLRSRSSLRSVGNCSLNYQ